jgi:hypothetical protein
VEGTIVYPDGPWCLISHDVGGDLRVFVNGVQVGFFPCATACAACSPTILDQVMERLGRTIDLLAGHRLTTASLSGVAAIGGSSTAYTR